MLINEIKSTINSDGDGKKIAMPSEKEDRIWRADPSDGLRPMRSIRSTWRP